MLGFGFEIQEPDSEDSDEDLPVAPESHRSSDRDPGDPPEKPEGSRRPGKDGTEGSADSGKISFSEVDAMTEEEEVFRIALETPSYKAPRARAVLDALIQQPAVSLDDAMLGSQDVCPVCLEELKSISCTLQKLTCGHILCAQCCMTISAHAMDFCPLCRDPLLPLVAPGDHVLVHVSDCGEDVADYLPFEVYRLLQGCAAVVSEEVQWPCVSAQDHRGRIVAIELSPSVGIGWAEEQVCCVDTARGAHSRIPAQTRVHIFIS